ncbi:MAG TPA: RNA polymerase sigma factor [Candidatus Limnocylindria bacterium]|nr:RNA polymerase sigma factor [Candidatus Limnocylindria bacterium]
MEIAAPRSRDATPELLADFDARFEGVRSRLTAVCIALAGADQAPDLVQETYLRASDRLHQLRDPALFEAWVVRIAMNEAKSLTRRARRERERLPSVHRAAPGPGRDAALRELVERLPARQRAVIVLHYAYGYRLGEVATLLGLSEINVRTLAFRGRRTLRNQLEETGR